MFECDSLTAFAAGVALATGVFAAHQIFSFVKEALRRKAECAAAKAEVELLQGQLKQAREQRDEATVTDMPLRDRAQPAVAEQRPSARETLAQRRSGGRQPLGTLSSGNSQLFGAKQRLASRSAAPPGRPCSVCDPRPRQSPPAPSAPGPRPRDPATCPEPAACPRREQQHAPEPGDQVPCTDPYSRHKQEQSDRSPSVPTPCPDPEARPRREQSTRSTSVPAPCPEPEVRPRRERSFRSTSVPAPSPDQEARHRREQSVPAPSRRQDRPCRPSRPDQKRGPAAVRSASKHQTRANTTSLPAAARRSASTSAAPPVRRGPSVGSSAPPSRASGGSSASGCSSRLARVPSLRLPKAGPSSPKHTAAPRAGRKASQSVPRLPLRQLGNPHAAEVGLPSPERRSEPRATADAWTAAMTPRPPVPAPGPRQGPADAVNAGALPQRSEPRTVDAWTAPITPRVPAPAPEPRPGSASVPPTPRDLATALRRLEEQRMETEALRRKAAEAERARAQVDQERRAALQDKERLAECEAAVLKREAEVDDMVAAARRAMERRAAEEKEEWMAEMKREAQRQLEALKAEVADRAQQPGGQHAGDDCSDRDGCDETAFFARLDGATKVAVLRLTGEDPPATFTGAAPGEGKTRYFARLPGAVKAAALQRWRDGHRASGSPAPASGVQHCPAAPGVPSRVAALLCGDRQQQIEELDEELDDLLQLV